jgi:hypothetical protein
MLWPTLLPSWASCCQRASQCHRLTAAPEWRQPLREGRRLLTASQGLVAGHISRRRQQQQQKEGEQGEHQQHPCLRSTSQAALRPLLPLG